MAAFAPRTGSAGAGLQAVVTGEVDHAAGLGAFGNGGPGGRQLLGGLGRAAGGVDHEVGGQLGSVLQPYAGDRGRRAGGDQQVLDEGLGADGHAGELFDIAAHDQFQRRAAAGEDGQVLVDGRRAIAFLVLGGQRALEAQLAAAGGEQVVQQLRVAVADKGAQAGQEGVAVAQVARRPGGSSRRTPRRPRLRGGGGSRSSRVISRPSPASAMAVQRPAMPAPITRIRSLISRSSPKTRGSLAELLAYAGEPGRFIGPVAGRAQSRRGRR